MMRRRRLGFMMLLAVLPATAGTQLLVTVVERKTGIPVTGLKAADFAVLDDKTPCVVESAEYRKRPVDVMLLVDSSLVGGMVQPAAADLIAQLEEKEQMAIVAFHSAADLIQDFTSSKELLGKALERIRYGNEPRVLDAVYAAADGGFQSATLRRVILLLTAGLEGSSRVSERAVVGLARKNAISIYALYLSGAERSMFEELARQTGGAAFSLSALAKAGKGPPAVQVFEAIRGHYLLTLRTNLSLGEKVKVEVKSPRRVNASALPVD